MAQFVLSSTLCRWAAYLVRHAARLQKSDPPHEKFVGPKVLDCIHGCVRPPLTLLSAACVSCRGTSLSRGQGTLDRDRGAIREITRGPSKHLASSAGDVLVSTPGRRSSTTIDCTACTSTECGASLQWFGVAHSSDGCTRDRIDVRAV